MNNELMSSSSSDSKKAKSQSEVIRPVDKNKRKLVKTKTCDDVAHHNPYEISEIASSNLGSAVE